MAILISLGRPTIPTIPTDHSVDRYRALLSERTLTWQDGDQVYSDDVPAGGVAETSPAVGQEVRTGTAVSVSLSKGPAPVAVPDVKGLSRSAAESALKSAGLKVARVDEGFISTTPKDHVFGILPAPGTEVTRGTEVVIQVSTALEVPDIVGMSQEEGTKKLQEAGIKVDQIKQDNTTGTKAHQVVGTAPRSWNPHRPKLVQRRYRRGQKGQSPQRGGQQTGRCQRKTRRSRTLRLKQRVRLLTGDHSKPPRWK